MTSTGPAQSSSYIQQRDLELVVERPGHDDLYARKPDGRGWQPFQALPNLVQLAPHMSRSERSVELDGDGIPDILVCEGKGLTFLPSLGRCGHGHSLQRRSSPRAFGPAPPLGPSPLHQEEPAGRPRPRA